MKRLQIMIEEDLDADLERMAADEGTSKAALIRRFVREHVKPLPPIEDDAIWKLVGAGSWDPDEDIDDVIYQ